MKKIYSSFFAVVFLISLFGVLIYLTKNYGNTEKSHNNGDYKNISCKIDSKVVNLKDGYAEVEIAPGSASKNIIRYFGNEVKGDFNGDGREDVAFLITQDTGGSGVFYYVVAGLNTGKGYSGTKAFLLGDRIAPQANEFVDGKIVVNYAVRGENDPMTASPSISVSKYLKVVGGNLEEVSK